MTRSSHRWDYHPRLKSAVLIWKRDLPITADHYADLIALGLDVDALEQKYRP